MTSCLERTWDCNAEWLNLIFHLALFLTLKRGQCVLDTEFSILLTWTLQKVTIDDVGCSFFPVTGTVPLQADPAVLVLALGTGHMITPFTLVALNAAIWTHFCFITLFPFLKLTIILATFYTRVRFLATFETYGLTTYAWDCFLEDTFLFNVAIAAWLRAPFKFRVHVNIDIKLELQVFFI